MQGRIVIGIDEIEVGKSKTPKEGWLIGAETWRQKFYG